MLGLNRKNYVYIKEVNKNRQKGNLSRSVNISMKNLEGKIKVVLIPKIFVIFSFLIFPGFLIAQTDLSKILSGGHNKLIPAGHTEYQVRVKTADIADAGTDSNIYLTIYGDGQNGITRNKIKRIISTPEVDISNNSSLSYNSSSGIALGEDNRYRVTFGTKKKEKISDSNMFERDSYHQINITTKDVGNITAIKIRKDNFGAAPDWNLEYVQIINGDKTIRFNAGKWFNSDSNTYTFRDWFNSIASYNVQIYTGDVTGAGTDANIFLTIEGFAANGKRVTLPEIRLNGLLSGNLFERHQIDIFELKQRFLQRITQIKLRSDNKYAAAGWNLGWVIVTQLGKFREVDKFTFNVNEWVQTGNLTKSLKTKYYSNSSMPDITSDSNYSQTASINESNTKPGPRSNCNFELKDWIGNWNTTKGQMSIKAEGDTLNAAFSNSDEIYQVSYISNVACGITLHDKSQPSNTKSLHLLEMKQAGSFSVIYDFELSKSLDKLEKWSGQKQDSANQVATTNSSEQTKPTNNQCKPTDWAGDWDTNLFPEMTLKVVPSGIAGVLKPANFQFLARYKESNPCILEGAWSIPGEGQSGAFRFIMKDKGSFEGAYVGKKDIGRDLSKEPLTWRGRKKTMQQNTSSAGLSPAKIAPTTPPTNSTLVNLSVGKSARQSSTEFGGLANRAVDGNTNGNWQNNSVTHTNRENQAWWEVDLGKVYNISQIKLFNRTDCCSDRLNQFRIVTSTNPFTSNASGVPFVPLQGTSNSNPLVFNGNTKARYVRIYLNGTGVLSLAEVQVWGTQ